LNNSRDVSMLDKLVPLLYRFLIIYFYEENFKFI